MKKTTPKRSKLKPLDDLFSKYVRLMSGGYCKRCWLMGKPNAYKGYERLHTAHFRRREIRATRWEYDNVAPLCCGCHRYLDGDSIDKNEFFLETLGTKRFNEIVAQSNSLHKPDMAEIKAELIEKIKYLETQ